MHRVGTACLMVRTHLQVYKAVKNDVIPVAAKMLAADGDEDAFAREVRGDFMHFFTPGWRTPLSP